MWALTGECSPLDEFVRNPLGERAGRLYLRRPGKRSQTVSGLFTPHARAGESHTSEQKRNRTRKVPVVMRVPRY